MAGLGFRFFMVRRLLLLLLLVPLLVLVLPFAAMPDDWTAVILVPLLLLPAEGEPSPGP
jgi:hypothetical protein